MCHQGQHRTLMSSLHGPGFHEGFGKLIPNMAVTFMCIYYRHSISSLTLCLIIGRTEMVGRMAAGQIHEQYELAERMKKVQKLVDLENIKQEIEDGTEPAKDWPQKGEIDISDVKLRYRPNCDLVLKGLSINIQPGLKVGVVGRTGAGKSTLGLTLLRILEMDSGSNKIDGVDLFSVPLQTLRQRVTTIPQDPTLFKGSLRFNIDPKEQHKDEEIDDLLERSGLGEILKYDKTKSMREFMVEENGNNLSSGEKQLVCICRAAIRKAKVVIFDEATANIDVVTEQKIQELIRVEFKQATVLTIAHRLNTIIASDRILVMSFGTKAEYGSPKELLQNPESHFSGLVKELEAEEKKNKA